MRTDFILSAEIIAISLGVVATQPLSTQALVLSSIAMVMTVGVYGLVAGIVKLDDLGLYLSTKASAVARKFGAFLIAFTPYMMKTLTILGTAAMFLVGGGIIVHGVPALHHIDETLSTVVSMLLSGGVGLVVGAVVLAGVLLVQKLKSK